MAILVHSHLHIRMIDLIGMTIPALSTDKADASARASRFPEERRWDHTYVVSGECQRWGCFGRADGGHAICRGTADVRIADCLACDDGKAAINYLVTGVCHQAANRILYPANIIVSKARGYTISSSIYGDYGLGRWSQLQRCLHLQDEIAGYASGGPGLEEARAPYIVSPIVNGLEEHSPMSPLIGKYQDDPRRQALRKAIDDRLGMDYDLEKRRRLLDAQLDSFSDQDELIESFQNGRLSAESYFAELTRLTRDSFSKYADVIGPDDFVKLFDFPPDDIPPPGDPELFAKAHGLPKPPKVPD